MIGPGPGKLRPYGVLADCPPHNSPLTNLGAVVGSLLVASLAAAAGCSNPSNVNSDIQRDDANMASGSPIWSRALESTRSRSILSVGDFPNRQKRDGKAAAQPFLLTGDGRSQAQALACLTSAIYYEAGDQPEPGQRAVAQVVLNRVRHPNFPSTICGVVFQGATRKTGCQFTFACDGSLFRIPSRGLWRRAEQIASEALSGFVFAPVGLSTFYHAQSVKPYWSASLGLDGSIGAHIFYGYPRVRGLSFDQSYSAHETDIHLLKAAAVLASDSHDPHRPNMPPPVEVTVHPAAELLGTVAILANSSSGAATPYEEEVREAFKLLEDHDAVRRFRELTENSTSEEAREDDFQQWLSALKDFSERSDFDRFYRLHRAYYEQSSARIQNELSAAAAAWEIYTGIKLGRRQAPEAVMIEPLLACSRSAAMLDRKGVTWLPAGADVPRLFLAAGLSDKLFPASRRPKVAPALREQVVQAVFARIEAVRGVGTRRSATGAGTRSDNRRVKLLAERLVQFEKHRSKYPTLKEFLPVLLRGMSERNATANDASLEEAEPSRCSEESGAENVT